jgi:hypothetical protein
MDLAAARKRVKLRTAMLPRSTGAAFSWTHVLLVRPLIQTVSFEEIMTSSPFVGGNASGNVLLISWNRLTKLFAAVE